MNITRTLLLLGIVGVLAGCKLVVGVGEGGSVLSGSGGNNWGGNSFCEIEILDTDFSDTFTAIPATGYAFSRWEEGDGFLCGNSTNATCTVDNTGLAGNATADAVIAKNRALYIRPIFKPVSGYLGMTSSSYDGSAIISWWTAACQADYGSQAAVCNTKQIFESHGLANITPPNDGMWVTPFVVGGSGSSYVEYGGAGFQSRKAFCFNNSSGYQGTTIRYDFQVLNATCNLELPIACCR